MSSFNCLHTNLPCIYRFCVCMPTWMYASMHACLYALLKYWKSKAENISRIIFTLFPLIFSNWRFTNVYVNVCIHVCNSFDVYLSSGNSTKCGISMAEGPCHSLSRSVLWVVVSLNRGSNRSSSCLCNNPDEISQPIYIARS